MENNKKQIRQSDILRDKARVFSIIYVFIDIIIVIINFILLSSVPVTPATRGAISLAILLLTGFEIFSVNSFIIAKRESYMTQADMLDVLTDIRDDKKKQEE